MNMTGNGQPERPDRTWKVGALARATGLTVRTLHYYDQIGLLQPSARLAGGHRLYDATDAARLYRIIRLRQLGFPLSQVADVLRNRNGSWLPPSNAISPNPGAGLRWLPGSPRGSQRWPRNWRATMTPRPRSCALP